MTIEQLIDLAVFNVQYASDNTAFDHAERAVCAATAQAAAMTAQAMMIFDQWQDYNRDALENERSDWRDAQ